MFSDVKIIIEDSKVVGSRLCILGCDFIDERTEEEISRDKKKSILEKERIKLQKELKKKEELAKKRKKEIWE